MVYECVVCVMLGVDVVALSARSLQTALSMIAVCREVAQRGVHAT